MNDLSTTVFSLDPSATFLNHGSFGATPRQVIEARRAWEDRIEAQPVHYLWDLWADDIRRVVDRVADFVGADPADLTLVENATTGMNAALDAIDWAPGDKVVLLSHAYAAVLHTVRDLAERFDLQIVLAEVPFPLGDPAAAVEALEKVISGARVAVIDHITSPTGLVMPLDQLLAVCRRHGVFSMVDAAHAPGQIPLKLSELDADVYVGNLHKWAFAARGTAILHKRPGTAGPRALVTSHGFRGDLQDRFLWPGTRDFTGWLATPTALEVHRTLGGDALMARNRRVAAEAGDWLADRWGCCLPSPPECRAALCAVPLPDGIWWPEGEATEAARLFSRRLWNEHGVEVPIIAFGDGRWVRFSIQAYNEVEDVERMAAAIEAVGESVQSE